MPATSLPAIVTVNTSDCGGGAEQFARLMHETSRKQGIDARMLVGNKETTDESIIPFWGSPYFDYRPFERPLRNQLREFERTIQCMMGIEDFLHPYSHFPDEIAGLNSPILHLHNLHGGYFDLRSLPDLSRKFHIVWTLHDYWPLTGHCAYPLACDRWRDQCGNCPDLERSPAIARDATRFNLRRKQQIFSRTRLRIAASSQALIDRIPGSILEPAVIEARKIPYGVDLDTFHPGDARAAREQLGLPLEKPLVLFSAYNALSNPYKDFQTIAEAMRIIKERAPDKEIELVVLGANETDKCDLGFPAHVIPFSTSRAEVADYLRAVDLYLHAARDEVFGIVLLEAMASGTPVIATSVGGIPEVFENGSEGLLVTQGDPELMSNAVLELLTSKEKLSQFADRGIQKARADYDIRKSHQVYLSWFEELCRTPTEASDT